MDIDNKEKLLVASFKKGDQEAFAILYKKYSKILYQYIFFIIKHKEQAEGIVQDVFVKVWEEKENLNENLSFSAYIHTIARNKFYDFIRKSINRQSYKKFLANKTNNHLNQTELDVNYRELIEKVDNLINQLPPKRKRIYEMCKKEGMTRKEISEKLNLSISTVDNQLIKAKKFIRNGLTEYGFCVILFLLITGI